MTNSNESNNYPAVQFRIARSTSRLQEVTKFYTDGLQLKVLFSFEGHGKYSGVMIGLPGVHHHLEFTQDAEAAESRAPGKDNLLVLYFNTMEDLNKIRASLERLGHQPVEPENPYWRIKAGLTKTLTAGG
jgi:hypothetical protein